MREFFHAVAAALIIAAMAGALASTSTPASAQASQQAAPPQAAPLQSAPSQDMPPALQQMALTDKQIEGVLAAQKDMDAITEKLPDNEKPDPRALEQLEAAAKKHGFAGYDEYNVVIDNISLVLGGFDPATKKYVGPEAVIKTQIARVEADKKFPAKEKKEALAELNEMLKSPAPPIENKANIELVAKYYDKLAEALGDNQE
jgi:hypothetical protein